MDPLSSDSAPSQPPAEDAGTRERHGDMQGLTPSAASRGSGSKPATAWEPPTPEELQQEIVQYKILELLGRGGMGAVYKGWQVSLDRYVAIKIMPPGVDDADAQFTARFKQEARTMAKFQHPGIVSVYDAGETGTGLLYIVMEFVEGTDVSQMVKSQGRLTPAYALAITAHVCDALQYAHSHGVIHRDIKPANVMLNLEGAVKVADFGLAKGSDTGSSGLTRTNMAMGTPDYVAPEVLVAGTPVDHRADLYSVGVMLFNMLTGEIPRGMFKMPSQKVGTDPRFDAIIRKAMEQEREGRYQSAEEIRRDLEAILSTPQAQGEEAPASQPPSQPSRKPVARAPHARKDATQGVPQSGKAPDPRAPGRPKKSSSVIPVLVVGALALASIGAFFALRKPQPAAPAGDSPGVAVTSAPEPATGPAAAVAANTPAPAEPGNDAVKGDSRPAPSPIVTGIPSSLTVPASPPPPSVLPVEAVKPQTGWTNLLANVDVKRDTVTGDWSMENGELVSIDGSASHRTLELPVAQEPKNYDLRIQVTRRKGGAAMFFALRGDGNGAAVHFDGWTGNRENSSEVTAVLAGAVEEPGGKFVNPRPFFGDLARHEILIQVRADRVAVRLDGKELLNRKGGLAGLAQSDNSFLPQGARPGPIFAVGVCGGEAVFHSIEMRSADAAVALAPHIPEMPATLPGDARLAQLEAGFKTRYDADAQKAFLATLATLNRSYVANGIARARAASLKAGRLEEVTALDAEKARIERGDGVPAEDPAGTPATLAGLRKTYRLALAKHTAERDRKAAPLYDLYLGALDTYIAELTKADRLDDARKVKTLRDEIAAKKPDATTAAAAAAARSEPPKSVPAVPLKTTEVKPAGGSYWREAAKWLVTNGGTCRVVSNKIELEVKTERDLPAGKFDIVELNFDRLNSVLPPPADADFRVFNGLKTLRRVWVRTPGLGDEAFAFLAANPDLAWLNLEGVSDLTDDVLLYLANARKLALCYITGAKNFTGSGLAQMRWLPALTNADFFGASFSDDGLKALAACKQLKTLRLTGGAATDAGFAPLRGLKSLTSLTVSNCAFGDAAAAAIAEIGGLVALDLTTTKLTDTGLAKLMALKRLTSLNVGGSQVTEAAAAAFQKALPQCRVMR